MILNKENVVKCINCDKEFEVIFIEGDFINNPSRFKCLKCKIKDNAKSLDKLLSIIFNSEIKVN